MKSSASTLVLERGILTSSYKREIRNNIRSMRTKSLSNMKQRIKANSNRMQCSTSTALKVSMFFVAMVMIVF